MILASRCHCRHTLPCRPLSLIVIAMLIMLPHAHVCSTPMVRPTDPEVYHPNHDVYLNDPGKESNLMDCSGFTTGGCSGKRVGIPFIVTLLVSLPSGCHAVNSMEVLAVASTLAHLTDGPTAILQWLLYKKAPSVAATLESYRWEPFHKRVPRSNEEGKATEQDTDEFGYELPQFEFTPPAQWIVVAWLCASLLLLYNLMCWCCRSRPGTAQRVPIAYNVKLFTSGFWSRARNSNPNRS